MGIRYQKRVNLGDGMGLNLSKSGISSSYRTKYGTIGAKGFSIRTGIPGLTYRSGYRKSKGIDGVLTLVLAMAVVGAAIIIWNVFLFLKWAAVEGYKWIKRKRLERIIKREEGFS